MASKPPALSHLLANQLMIAVARPSARKVAGFRKWLELGYAIRSRPADVPEGAWAIRIRAPCPPTRKQLERWQREGANPDTCTRTYFKIGRVFGDDQVDPLPPPAKPLGPDSGTPRGSVDGAVDVRSEVRTNRACRFRQLAMSVERRARRPLRVVRRM
jgi:hypothetical protein